MSKEWKVESSSAMFFLLSSPSSTLYMTSLYGFSSVGKISMSFLHDNSLHWLNWGIIVKYLWFISNNWENHSELNPGEHTDKRPFRSAAVGFEELPGSTVTKRTKRSKRPRDTNHINTQIRTPIRTDEMAYVSRSLVLVYILQFISRELVL